VSEGILPSDVEIREEGDTMWIEAKDLPGFYDFPDQLVQQLHERSERDEMQDRSDPNPVTASQLKCLRFMQMPFDPRKVLSSYRANILIRRFAEIDPEYYYEYLRDKEESRVYSPQRIQQSSPQIATRRSSGNIIAAVASFFFPGLGQLVQGRVFAAFTHFLITVLLLLVAFASVGILAPLVFIAMIVSCLDAARWSGRG